MPPEPSWARLRKPAQLVAAIAFTFHTAAIGAVHLPATSTLRPGAMRVFGGYLGMSGSWQSWLMFTTIPYYHDYDIELVLHYSDGHEARRGPILPGFRPFDHTTRAYTYFVNMVPQDMHRTWFAYMTRACESLEPAAFTQGA